MTDDKTTEEKIYEKVTKKQICEILISIQRQLLNQGRMLEKLSEGQDSLRRDMNSIRQDLVHVREDLMRLEVSHKGIGIDIERINVRLELVDD